MLDKIFELYKTKIRNPLIEKELNTTRMDIVFYGQPLLNLESHPNKPTSLFSHPSGIIASYICIVAEGRSKIEELKEKESRLLNKLGIQNAN